MNLNEINDYYLKFKYGEDNFHNLMQFRVREILLVSTFYDAYIFEHDGMLSEQIVGEYHQLNLTTVPRVTSVPTCEAALKKLDEFNYDLVITTMRIGENIPFELSNKIKEKSPDLPVLLFLTVHSDVKLVEKHHDRLGNIDKIFLWNGDSKLFLAMIKYVEDKKNVEYDTENGLVRVILLVEDSIVFHSIYLPILYTEIMEQTQRLISEELNDNKKYYRMRTRPKVLLVNSYEDALDIYKKYSDYLLCVISDVQYYKSGKLDHQAGIKLLRLLKDKNTDLPMLLQSSDINNKKIAEKLGVIFFHKKSQFLLNDIRHFILTSLGFGDFVFRDIEGKEIARAHYLSDFEKILPDIPVKSLLYHSEKNDFSGWLIAHGEIQVARKLRPVKNSDFSSPEDHRKFLIDTFKNVRNTRNRGRIIDFDLSYLDNEDIIVRMGAGSLGGKGRGLAFFNALLITTEINNKYQGAKIKVPTTAIIGTVEFDYFIEKNELYYIRDSANDSKIKKDFLKAKLSKALIYKLTKYLEICERPIAVRSSGLLEDSQSQPFAGVYQTYMLPNNNTSLKVRLKYLMDAIKLVYASVFLKEARNYIDSLDLIIEEEKMAVIIQEVVGEKYENSFYPHFSGVAQSYNYYPVSYMKHDNGVASIAVGLGQSVVGGGKHYRFCPKFPELQYGSIEDSLKNSQTEFYALNLEGKDTDISKGEYETLIKLGLEESEKDGTLIHLASVWDSYNNRMEDGINRPGPRVVNFADILKHEYFPASKMLNEILDFSEKALGIPVEIEFAVDLKNNAKSNIFPTFYLLQVRPQTVSIDDTEITKNDIENKDLFIFTNKGLGHGIIDNIHDIVYIDPDKFDKTKTIDIKMELGIFNEKMREKNCEYILIGPGRWGSRDKFLGVPVIWAQIDKAKVIVETGIKDFDIEPSQGTHFFHNLIAMNVGYLNIPYNTSSEAFIDWKWLKSIKVKNEGKYYKHIVSKKAFIVKMDGRKGLSMISK